jgi:hypothetical protein
MTAASGIPARLLHFPRLASCDAEAAAGTVKIHCSGVFTDMCDGATYQSTWLDVGAR